MKYAKNMLNFCKNIRDDNKLTSILETNFRKSENDKLFLFYEIIILLWGRDLKNLIAQIEINHFQNILRLLMFYQIFLSPQVKRCVIITYKHGLYEFPHELPNNLRLRILGN